MSSRRRTACLALAVAVSIPPCAAASAGAAPDRTNIVFILVDDLGWMDLRCQGNERLDTPNIDRLASQGMRFTDAYAAAPVCSPSRAAILTGKSPARLNLTTHIPDRPGFTPENAPLLSAKTLDRLPLEHVTIAERLRRLDYATAFVGKWHLCRKDVPAGAGRGKPPFYPERQGFDVNVAGCSFGGPPTYFDPYRIPTLTNRREGEYLPRRLADESVAFLRAHRGEPFLLCLWTYAVHWPMEAPKALVDKYADRKGPGLKDPRYGAMIEALDAAIGRVLRALDELKVADRTLVIFTSDNGGFTGVADNRPLRSGKGFLYEGGIRVPLIVRWPGVVKPGKICRTPVIGMDFFPTLLEAAGLEPEAGVPVDGESLMPLLRGSGSLKRDAIYFHFPNYAWHRSNRLGGAVRAGRYKLIERFDDGSVELYDLEDDLGELSDLSTRMAERASQLKRRLRAWRQASGASMPPPRTE